MLRAEAQVPWLARRSALLPKKASDIASQPPASPCPPDLSLVHPQHVTVGKHHFTGVASGKRHRRSVFCGGQGNRHLISCLERVSAPAIPVQNARTLRFDGPIHHRTLAVLYVNIKLAMRI